MKLSINCNDSLWNIFIIVNHAASFTMLFSRITGIRKLAGMEEVKNDKSSVEWSFYQMLPVYESIGLDDLNYFSLRSLHHLKYISTIAPGLSHS